MNQHERKQLLEANRRLMELRKELKPIDLKQIQVALVERKVSDAEIAYFEAIGFFEDRTTGEPGNERQAIQGRQELWNSFNSDRHQQLTNAVRVVRDWYNHRLDVGGGLILAGGCGSGKSHLAKAVWELYGYGAVYWNEIRLIEVLQSGYGGGGRTEESVFADVRRAKLLIYDDLGAYQTTNLEWLQRVYYNLFDSREEDGKATMITTNLPLVFGQSKPFEDRVGRRVFSRIMGQINERQYYVDMFAVPDYRTRKFDTRKKNGER